MKWIVRLLAAVGAWHVASSGLSRLHASRDATVRSLWLSTAYIQSAAVGWFATLRVADAIGAAGGSVGCDELVAALNSTSSQRDFICQLLSSWEALGLVARAADGQYSITASGQSVGGELSAWVRYQSVLSPMVEEGLRLASAGRCFDFYGTAAVVSEAGRREFDEAMASITASQLPALLTLDRWGGCSRWCDVGGGSGALAAGLLQAHSGLRMVVADGSNASIGAALERFRSAGVEGRAGAVTYDFFSGPRLAEAAPCDCAVLKGVTSDWGDEQLAALLQRVVSQRMRKVLLLDHFVGIEAGGPAEVFRHTMDLMMLGLLGAKQRSADDLREVLRSVAGWRVDGAEPVPNTALGLVTLRPV